MQISETLGNEIKNKFEEDWQDYIDENSIPEEEQAENKEAYKEIWVTENEDFLDAIIENVDHLDEIEYLTDALDYKKFHPINDKYLPDMDESDTMANQIVTAINKLVYKWYNDGDVFDNVNSGLTGWANDLSDYANWLYQYVPETKNILSDVFDIHNTSDYEIILKELADLCLNEDFLSKYNEKPKKLLFMNVMVLLNFQCKMKMKMKMKTMKNGIKI